MNEEIEILTAKYGDATEIAKLSYQVGKMHDEAMPDYFRPTNMDSHLTTTRKMILDNKIQVFKAVVEGKIRGFLFLYVPTEPRRGFVHMLTGYVYNLGVDESYRNRGIGTKLMKTAEMYLWERKIRAMALNVFRFNEQALRFYEKLGYKDIEVTLHRVLK